MPTPTEEAAAIMNHYFAQLAGLNGLHWSERNAADIAHAVALLGQADAAPTLDEVPPYQPPIRSDRVTQVFDRDDYGDPEFGNWRKRQRDAEHDTRRMLRRDGR